MTKFTPSGWDTFLIVEHVEDLLNPDTSIIRKVWLLDRAFFWEDSPLGHFRVSRHSLALANGEDIPAELLLCLSTALNEYYASLLKDTNSLVIPFVGISPKGLVKRTRLGWELSDGTVVTKKPRPFYNTMVYSIADVLDLKNRTFRNYVISHGFLDIKTLPYKSKLLKGAWIDVMSIIAVLDKSRSYQQRSNAVDNILRSGSIYHVTKDDSDNRLKLRTMRKDLSKGRPIPGKTSTDIRYQKGLRLREFRFLLSLLDEYCRAMGLPLMPYTDNYIYKTGNVSTKKKRQIGHDF